MRCACPWCSRDAEPGCVAMFSGEPTCSEHGYKAMIGFMKEIKDSLGGKKDESIHSPEPRRD